MGMIIIYLKDQSSNWVYFIQLTTDKENKFIALIKDFIENFQHIFNELKEF